jgi:integrase
MARLWSALAEGESSANSHGKESLHSQKISLDKNECDRYNRILGFSQAKQEHGLDRVGGLGEGKAKPSKGFGFKPSRQPREQTANELTNSQARASPKPSAGEAELISSRSLFATPHAFEQTPSPATSTPTPHTLSSQSGTSATPSLSLSALRDKYLDWLQRHRSNALHREAKRHLQRWCDSVGNREALAIAGADLEAFQDALAGNGHARMYVKKHVTSVRACFNKGVKMGWLPPGFKPFALVEGIRLDPKPLLEGDLPTDAEVKALLDTAQDKPMLHAIVSLYHATGCRTHELIEARVGDFQPQSRTIVLGKHKRSKTLREAIPRTITLNAIAYALLRQHCGGREAGDLIFPNRAGKGFTSVLLDDMFARLRKRAGVREGVTPYSFRHLWISEALAAGVDVLLVARMAGTSVKMIESVYGHFRTQSFTDAMAKVDAMRKARNCS